MKKALLTGAALLATLAGSNAYAERDYISIVGSSTVYPFSTVVLSVLVNLAASRLQKLNLQVQAAA